MSASVKQMMVSILNLSKKEKISLGKSCMLRIKTLLRKRGIDDEKKINAFINNLIKLFVSADNDCTKSECEYLNALTGKQLSYDDYVKMTKGGSDPVFIEKFDKLIDSLDPEEKNQICLFGLCILVSDNVLSVEEQEIFLKILK